MQTMTGKAHAMLAGDVLDEIKRRLKTVHGDRLRGVILYGSEARGEGRPDSDVDLLVLLDGPIDLVRDMAACLDAVYPIALQIGRRISAKPVDAREYERAVWPFYRNVRREGIPV